jgi:hypothetical protein
MNVLSILIGVMVGFFITIVLELVAVWFFLFRD